MIKSLMLLVGCVALGCLGRLAAAADGIEITPLAGVPAGLPVVPWVPATEKNWSQGKSTFSVADAAHGLSAQGWIAVNRDDVLVRVDVVDPVHINDQTGANIWNGDFLRVSIDGRGDGPGIAAPGTSGPYGPDDASIAVALTPTGGQGWVMASGQPGHEGAYPAKLVAAGRDEATKTTHYELKVPWAWLQTPAGAYPTIGLAIQVRDIQKPEQGQPTHLRWGAEAETMRTDQFEKLALGASPESLAGVGVLREALLAGQDAQMVAAIAGQRTPVRLAATYQGARQALDVPPGAGVQRFLVRAWPGTLGREPQPFTVSLSSEGRELATAAAQVSDMGAPISDALTRLESLAATADQPLLANAYRGAAAVLSDEWRKAQIVGAADLARARTCAADAQHLMDLVKDPLTWADVAAGRRPLFVPFIARSDGSLQFYFVTLPRGFDATQTYPLVLYLHGRGSADPLGFVGAAFSLPDEHKPKYADDKCITVLPWARGNFGYHAIGESDVREALADVRRLFKTDPDRTYLAGFSMGGAGTWALMHTSPGEWAAAAILSGADWELPVGQGLSVNVQHLPIMIWHGTTDGAVSVDAAYRMQKELEKFGIKPVMKIVPGQGHTQDADETDEVMHWLLQHRRQRPDSFTFVSGDSGRGVWGITLGRSRGARQQIACNVDGNTVRIASTPAGTLNVDLGPGGLGLSGNVTVYWNDAKRYEGPAEMIHLSVQDAAAH